MLRTFCRRASGCRLKQQFKTCTSTTSVHLCSNWSQPEVSKDDFKFVERILPRTTIPEPPKHSSYPTPSGWVPPSEEAVDLPYYVRRTRFHHLPVYLEISNGGTRHLTIIKKVEGNIWTLESDLKEYVENIEGRKLYTAVDELCSRIKVRGAKLEIVKDFLLDKGF